MKQYIQDNIINILGVQDLDDEQKLALIDQTSELVEKRTLVKILERLSEEKRNEFMDLLDENDQTKIDKFLSGEVPDFLDLIAQETLTVKQELGEEMEVMNKKSGT